MARFRLTRVAEVTMALDKVADELQGSGFEKQAEMIDAVSDLLEGKTAFLGFGGPKEFPVDLISKLGFKNIGSNIYSRTGADINKFPGIAKELEKVLKGGKDARASLYLKYNGANRLKMLGEKVRKSHPYNITDDLKTGKPRSQMEGLATFQSGSIEKACSKMMDLYKEIKPFTNKSMLAITMQKVLVKGKEKSVSVVLESRGSEAAERPTDTSKSENRPEHAEWYKDMLREKGEEEKRREQQKPRNVVYNPDQPAREYGSNWQQDPSTGEMVQTI